MNEIAKKVAYTVEVDNPGCAQCGAKKSWTVVGPDGYGSGVSYLDEEDADDQALALNDAYERGQADAKASD